MTTFGERLKQIRKEIRLTQNQAAEKIGVSQQAWQAAESDRTELSAKRIKSIAALFGVNVAWLMSGVGSKDGETLEIAEDKSDQLINLIDKKMLIRMASKRSLRKIEVLEQMYLPAIITNSEVFAYQVEGSAMAPIINDQAIVLFEKVKDKSDFQDHSIYVVVAHGVIFIRKMMMILSGKNKGAFELSNITDGKSEVVKPKDISGWFKVVYVINPL